VLNNNISATGKEDRFRLSDDSWGRLIDIYVRKKNRRPSTEPWGRNSILYNTLAAWIFMTVDNGDIY
jgi:hypothetical protein